MLTLSGCVNAGSLKALCDRTADSRTAHAKALGESTDKGPATTGRILISQIDAGCAKT